MAKQPKTPADSEITVLRKDNRTDRRIAVVAEPTNTYAVHAQSVHADTSRVIKRGDGNGDGQVQSYRDRGYQAD